MPTHPVTLLVEFASHSIPYFRIASHRFGGWDLRVTQVLPLLSLACFDSCFIILFSYPPCQIEDVPAIDAIVLSVCPVYLIIRSQQRYMSPSATIMTSTLLTYPSSSHRVFVPLNTAIYRSHALRTPPHALPRARLVGRASSTNNPLNQKH